MEDENAGDAGFEPRTVNEHRGSRRDPEERPIDRTHAEQVREKMLDKTLADSFPTSNPPHHTRSKRGCARLKNTS